MNRRKVVIIGLDGVPCSLLREYIGRGIMPNLADMIPDGDLLQMRSTLPEVSSVAWSSFMTGRNPSDHGIFGFTEIDRYTYDYIFPNFDSLKETPFWEKRKLRTVALNIPQTYPARPFDGVMVSGFVAIDLKRATYPGRIYDYLQGIDYRLDVRGKLATTDPAAFFEDLFITFGKRKEAAEYLYDNEEWDVFIGTITETDRLHHFFFDSANGGPYYAVFDRFYRELDAFIGLMYEKAKRDGALFITCSDHGFAAVDTEVYLNNWLRELGYLKLSGGQGLQGITHDSVGFCLDPSRIYIHLAGKYERGRVNASEYDRLRDEISMELLKLRHEGSNVINRVFLREELFKGKFAGDGPDIYALPVNGFDLKGAADRKGIFGKTHFRGMHTYDDAHLYASEKNIFPADLAIEDIADILSECIKSPD